MEICRLSVVVQAYNSRHWEDRNMIIMIWDQPRPLKKNDSKKDPKSKSKPSMVIHACNPSYMRGIKEDCGQRLAWAETVRDSMWK
jgi:hypothetical protein